MTGRRLLPAGACDCHVHFYGDAARYPTRAIDALAPQSGSAAQYAEVMARLGVERVVAVQSILYGFDNRCLLDGMALLGERARGIATVAPDASAAALRALDRHGVRGARAYLREGGTLAWDEILPLAQRIAPLGWHLQLQCDGEALPRRERLLRSLPCPLVVDHVGRAGGAGEAGADTLLRLLDEGRCWVKLAAPYESSRAGPPGYEDVAAIARRLVAHAPERMLWASNWPHAGRADKPCEEALLDLLFDWTPSPAVAARVLAANPASLYGFPPLRDDHDPRTARTHPAWRNP